MNELAGWFRENKYLVAVIFLSIAVLAGQVVDAGAFGLEDMPDALRAVVDPIQFMVGMLIISYIFVLISIRKYELFPNPLLNIVKWYFSIMLINDFIALVFSLIQKSNIQSFAKSSLGTGKIYLILNSTRSIIDLTISSAAVCLLIYGLSRYKFLHDDGTLSSNRMGRVIILFVILKWVLSIPVNMTGLLTSQSVFVLSLIVFLTAGLISIILILMMVNELKTRYMTGFFSYLAKYYSVALIAIALNFTYSMGSYKIIQRIPDGDIQMLGWFGKLVLFITLVAQALQNYYMYKALNGYDEGETLNLRENTAVEIPQVTVAGEQ